MPSPKKMTPGFAPPMPSLSIELPPYVVLKKRGGGVAFYFQVPKRLRPIGWAGAYRLPLDPAKRTGLADAAELGAVVQDGETLYDRLAGERRGVPDLVRLNSLPWLIQAYDNHLRTAPRERQIAKKTLRQYDYAARQVKAWSKEGGDRHVNTISRPGIIAFLETMNATPTKRKHVAGYLRGLLFFAMDRGLRADNPAIRLKTEVPKARVHIWSDSELTAMMSTADALGLTSIGTAMLIAHDEGPRPCDVLAFERFRDYTPFDGCFRYWQQKTDDWVVSPAGKRVRGRLSRQPELQRPLVMNLNTSRKYNERVFIRDFDRVRTASGLSHLQFRHLRHTFVVKAKRAGLDPFAIASKTGHSEKSVSDMLRNHYLPHDSEVATNATAKIEAYRERKSDAKV